MAPYLQFLRRVCMDLTRLDISVSMAETIVTMHAIITATSLYLSRLLCLDGELLNATHIPIRIALRFTPQ